MTDTQLSKPGTGPDDDSTNDENAVTVEHTDDIHVVDDDDGDGEEHDHEHDIDVIDDGDGDEHDVVDEPVEGIQPAVPVIVVPVSVVPEQGGGQRELPHALTTYAASGAAGPARERRFLRRRPSDRTLTRVFVLVLVTLVAFKVLNYVDPSIRPSAVVQAVPDTIGWAKRTYQDSPWLHSCSKPAVQVRVPGGYVCADSAVRRTPFDKTFLNSPLHPGARAAIFTSVRDGSKDRADELLRGVLSVEGAKSITLAGGVPTWSEDPGEDPYWRTQVYSLRPTADLLHAYVATGDAKYARAVMAWDRSFNKNARDSKFAFSDVQTVSARAMNLTYAWWTLREHHQLTSANSRILLNEISRTADFLASRDHYRPEHGHATSSSAALLLIGSSFPALENSDTWLTIARHRLASTISTLVDGDGALIDHSPYYDFDSLEKLWQVYTFAEANHVRVMPDFRQRIAAMVNYATYILLPDSSVPLLGSSLPLSVQNRGVMRQIAGQFPEFKYVLTHGKSGTRPEHTSVTFPHTGLTLMRSGWAKGGDYSDQSALSFNVGAYRSTRNALDLLGVTLYAHGQSLLPGPGLYSYEAGDLRDYFHGTASHNAMVVDGKSQAQTSVKPGEFHTDNGVTYQSAQVSAYDGVSQQRMVAMLDKSHFLVVDKMSSLTQHDYDQTWHLFHGAKYSARGKTVTGSAGGNRQITISQLGDDDDPLTLMPNGKISRSEPGGPVGQCSVEYGVAQSCRQVVYHRWDDNATFVTMLSVGKDSTKATATYNATSDTVTFASSSKKVTLKLGQTLARDQSITVAHRTPPTDTATDVWWASNNTTRFPVAGGTRTVQQVADRWGVGMTPAAGGETSMSTPWPLDLSASNFGVSFAISGIANAGDVRVELSNASSGRTASLDLRKSYPARYGEQWLDLSLGRTTNEPGVAGTWTVSDGFDWASVDTIRFSMKSKGPGKQPTFWLNRFVTRPQPDKGTVSIVFDDGYNSILPAARYLDSLRLPANVAVIAKYARSPTHGYLSIDQLRRMQNRHGWNMVNHSERHNDAIVDYFERPNFTAYRNDVLAGHNFLDKQGLNSAPNWFIYPHGSTNTTLEQVVGRYYKFARTTDAAPEAYPFGDPLRVKTLEVERTADGEDAGTTNLSAEQVSAAVSDAATYHNTLILTFHRIDNGGRNDSGYPIGDFTTIVDQIKQLSTGDSASLKVVTFSQLDPLMGASSSVEVMQKPYVPAQISVKADVDNKNVFSRLLDKIGL